MSSAINCSSPQSSSLDVIKSKTLFNDSVSNLLNISSLSKQPENILKTGESKLKMPKLIDMSQKPLSPKRLKLPYLYDPTGAIDLSARADCQQTEPSFTDENGTLDLSVKKVNPVVTSDVNAIANICDSDQPLDFSKPFVKPSVVSNEQPKFAMPTENFKRLIIHANKISVKLNQLV